MQKTLISRFHLNGDYDDDYLGTSKKYLGRVHLAVVTTPFKGPLEH